MLAVVNKTSSIILTFLSFIKSSGHHDSNQPVDQVLSKKQTSSPNTASQPASQPTNQPTNQPASQLASQPANQPTRSVYFHPVSEPTLLFQSDEPDLSQPANPLSIWPSASQPVSYPARQLSYIHESSQPVSQSSQVCQTRLASQTSQAKPGQLASQPGRWADSQAVQHRSRAAPQLRHVKTEYRLHTRKAGGGRRRARVESRAGGGREGGRSEEGGRRGWATSEGGLKVSRTRTPYQSRGAPPLLLRSLPGLVWSGTVRPRRSVGIARSVDMELWMTDVTNVR